MYSILLVGIPKTYSFLTKGYVLGITNNIVLRRRCVLLYSPTGRALDGIQTLTRLSTLDLSYNSLGDRSFGSAQEEAAPEETRGRSSCIGPRWEGGVELSTYDMFPMLEFLDLSWNVICDLGGILRGLG